MKNIRLKKVGVIMIGGLCVMIVIAAVIVLLAFTANKAKVFGTDIAAEALTEFYYTRSSSTNPPDYQRYRFYTEDGTRKFYHEKREGSHWPLTEDDITLAATVELTAEEWAEFLHYISGGTVTRRSDSAEAGDSGPWLYLYWEGDRGTHQVFSFASSNEKKAFEAFCAKLAE